MFVQVRLPSPICLLDISETRYYFLGMVFTPMVYVDGMSDEVREARRNRSLLKTEGNGWDTVQLGSWLVTRHGG